MDKFIQAITDICLEVQPLAMPLLVLAVIVGGFCLMIPNQEFHAKAIKILPAAGIGFAIVMGAVELGASYASHF